MEIFRKGECSRFQASSHVANELGKWAGASEKEKGKAFDSYLTNINSFLAVLLRYDMSELREMGRGVEMWAVEAAERNWSVSLHRVKTWPQLMCCALI